MQQHRKQALHASPEARPGPAGDTQQAQQATAVAAAEEGTAHSETEVRPALFTHTGLVSHKLCQSSRTVQQWVIERSLLLQAAWLCRASEPVI